MMARMMLGSKKDVEATIADKGYISISDPTCGAGGMLVAAANVLARYGIDYTKYALFHGVELMPTTARTAFVQCAIYNMPAIIVHGNSLNMETFDTFVTAQGHELMHRVDWQSEEKEVV